MNLQIPSLTISLITERQKSKTTEKDKNKELVHKLTIHELTFMLES